MKPKYLKLINFMSHKQTEIDFSNLLNASIIIGMENGSLKSSNAIGKTTLLNAIYFALFDVTVGKKSRVIRVGEKKCEVEFIFKMSSGEYKIYRSRTKVTKVVQIYKFNNNDWENLSGRTPSHTEKTICSIIGTSQKMFEKSSYFKQKDRFDLASATPEKRKAIIIDMLHLKEWSLYEKEAKIIKVNLEKEIEILRKTILITGNPKNNILKNEELLSSLQNKIKEEQSKINQTENDLKNKIKTFDDLEDKNSNGITTLELQLTKESSKLNYLQLEDLKIKKEISDKSFKIKSLQASYDKNVKNINKYKKEYKDISSNCPKKISDEIYNKLFYKLTYCNKMIASLKSSLNVFKKDIPDDEICPTCFTELNEDNRKKLSKVKQNKLYKISIELEKELEKEIELKDKVIKCDQTIKEYKNYSKRKETYELEIYNTEKSISYIMEQLGYIKLSLDNLKEDSNSKIEAENNIKNIISSLKDEINVITNSDINQEIKKIKVQIIDCKNKLNSEKDTLMRLFSNKGGVEKEIETNKADSEKLKVRKDDLVKKEYDYSIYKTSTHAFSSYGIPSIIISTVLDSLQIETNAVLEILRPTIQIQFFLEKERSDGEQEDTLGMKFFINSIEWDYEELSGGQSACISLALKFAISVINRKRCGTDIKLLLLDEVDQGLDYSGKEAFYNVVKKWRPRLRL